MTFADGDEKLRFRIQLSRDGIVRTLGRLLRSRLIRQIQVDYLGRRLRIPLQGDIGRENIRAAGREQWMDDYLRYALGGSRSTFIDVGVNVGQTLIKVKCIDDAVDYVGFEANVTCAAYVATLIQANGFVDCVVIPCALSSQPGYATLMMSASDDPSASILDGYRPESFYTGPRRRVPLLTGDDYFARFAPEGRRVVIKIDVEGAELDVIKGLSQTIDRFQPDIVCEILPIYDQANVLRLEQSLAIWGLFEAMNYTIFRLHGQGDAEPVPEVQVHGDLALTNYAFVPAGRIDAFRDHYRLQAP